MKIKNKNRLPLHNNIWSNKYFKYILIPVLVGIIVIALSMIFINDSSNNQYNIKTENQSGGIAAGHIDNLTITNNQNNQKDTLIAEFYFTYLKLFLVKFQMILYAYYLDNNNTIPKKIDEVFNASLFPHKDSGSYNLGLLNDNIVKLIFTAYNFNRHTGVRFKNYKPTLKMSDTTDMVFYLPENIDVKDGDNFTGYVWFIGELKDLQKKCNDLLYKYASIGNPIIIDDLERLSNAIDNVIYSQRHRRLPYYEKYEIPTIQDFFKTYLISFGISKKYRYYRNDKNKDTAMVRKNAK